MTGLKNFGYDHQLQAKCTSTVRCFFYVDCCCRGLGAGAGNTQTEVLCAVLQRMGYNTGVNLYDIQDVAYQMAQEKKNN